ncbi:MAG: Uma2 family endonuclease [Deltaproteobacteria bacterium]|nr:Uma2 family endonuclease [Deltaproteobacteria bacterium]
MSLPERFDQQICSTVPLPIIPKMTYEEFLAWTDDTFAEWVDGEVTFMGPASFQHQDLAAFLTVLLRLYVNRKGLGKVCPAPFQMKTGPGLPGREPDIIFIAQNHLDQLKKNYLDGPADLAVEIISEDSKNRGRKQKLYEYQLGGVREYWLIDPEYQQAEFYQLGEDGLYHRAPLKQGQVYRSMVLNGVWIDVDWLWQDPLPSEINILEEWGVI